jgi:tetratricopeptide (TPR) repeat protein
MTPKQKERLQQKIKKFKSALAADKKLWGGSYHDGQGLRYAIPQLYIQLQDYSGAQRYFTWFNKNFPGDVGYPGFLFEWTLVLFYRGKTKEAERKAWEAFCSNTHLFDKFLGRLAATPEECEPTAPETAAALDSSPYSHKQAELADFAEWLQKFEQSEKFKHAAEKLITLKKEIKITDDLESRRYLIEAATQLNSCF